MTTDKQAGGRAQERTGRGERGGRGRDGGGRGRDGGRDGGRRGDRGDRGGGDRGGAEYRVLTEVSALEKALTKKDFAAQQGSLDRIAQGLRPLRLQSLAGLELNARGRLLTTVLRVQRQPRPASPEAAPAEAPPSEPSAEAPSEGAAPESAVPSEAAAPPAPAAPPADPWADLMVAVGRVWRATGEAERAAQAFESSGRAAPPDEAPPAAPAERAERTERSDRGGRGERPAREGREKREGRPARGEARPPRPVREPLTDWQLHARRVEESGRTRDAARIHEKHKGFLEAGRLYLVSNDKKAALRAFVLGGEEAAARKLMSELSAAEFRPVLEQAQGWGLLMEHLVQASDFEGVARLYERAKQFDQAGLAWERAGKLPQARKAFERAKDAAGSERVRAAEVQKLVERGDRLGAAQLLAQSGDKAAVLETLAPLPRAKAYRFLQRLKLDEEAQTLGREELEKAEASGLHDERARWLELTGDFPASAEAWLAAGRRERALQAFEKLGDWARAAPLAEELLQYGRAVALFHKAGNTADAERVAALPPPARPVAPQAAARPGDEEDAGTPESLPHPDGGA